MAKLLQTTVTGSLNISGSSLLMPLLTGSTDVDSGSVGQLWINSENGLNLKFTQCGSYGSQNSPFSCLGAFSAGGNLPSARSIVGGFGKSQNSSVLVGGSPPNAGTFHYDGKSWSSGGTLITNRGAYKHTAGTEFAGIVGGGFCAPDPGANATEEYNGSTWASGGSLIQARYNGSGAGFQNAMILVGGDGNPGSPYIRDCVEEYNGSTWAAAAAYYRQDRGHGVTGTQTATLGWGGYGPGTIVCTAYTYDGNAWSQTTTALRPVSFGGFFGSANAALSNTGYFSPSVRDCPETQEWNGTTWSMGCNMIQGRRSVGGSGTTFNGLLAGGRCGTPSSVDQILTEEYTKNLLQPFTYNDGASTNSWFGGPNMILARNSNMAAGTPSAGIVFGGQCAGGPVRVTCTEEFDGSAFAAGGALINANGAAASAGSQNAALMAGGLVPPAYKNITEEYNGSAWSAGNAIITTRGYIASWGGTQNAAFMAGGYSPGVLTCTEEYDGTNWATSNALSAATYLATGGGTQNAGIMAGGTQPGSSAYYSTSYHYDGSSWSSGGAMSTARGYQLGGGLQDDFTVGGGLTPSYVSNTERYNGVSWCTVTPQPYNTYLNQSAPQSGGSNMLAFGGYTPSPSAGFSGRTLFYCETTDIDSSIPYCLGAWSADANMITARALVGGAGTQNAGLAFGGQTPSASSLTEEYDGTSWTAGGALIIARSDMGGAGTQNAGLAFGGGTPSSSDATEEYGGSSWTSGGTLISARRLLAGGGTQNSALAFGGGPSVSNSTEEYNGSSWASGGNLIAARLGLVGVAASVNDGVAILGSTPTNTQATEHYDGSTWSLGGPTTIARRYAGAMGSNQGSVIVAGGKTNSAIASSEEYNGLAWANLSSLGNAREGTGGAGTVNAGAIFGGETPTLMANTEEWNCASYNIGAWSAGPNLGTARVAPADIGTTQKAALAVGGYASSTQYSCVEEYNGIVWSSTTATPVVRSRTGGAGTTNDGVFGGGYINDYTSCTSHWDGTSWTAGGNIITNRNASEFAGQTSDAVLMFGGLTGAYQNATEEYNGTSWSTKNAMITARGYLGGGGTSESAVAFNGQTPTSVRCVEEFDGTNWSAATNSPVATGINFGTGASNTAALSSAGYPQGGTTDSYNGIAFTRKAPSLVAHRNYGKMVGTNDAAVMFLGQMPSVLATSEEFNDGTCGVPSNQINEGIYCFVKNLAPGNTDSSGTSYSSGY